MRRRRHLCNLKLVKKALIQGERNESIHNIGAKIHITNNNPPTTFIAAQKGVTKGEQIYAICAQSKVTGKRPKPELTPN